MTKKHLTVDQLRHKYPVVNICRILGISTSGYYKYLKREPKIENKQTNTLKQLILDIYKKRKGIYGYRRIKIDLIRIYKIDVKEKTVYRLMRLMGLKAVIRKKRFNKYTPSRSRYIGYVYPNVLNRQFTASKPVEKFVTDITYIKVESKKFYLSVIQDLCNNEIISYNVSKINDNYLVIETLKKAREKYDLTGVLIHSDQGHNYTSHEYNKFVTEHKMVPSMSRKGKCADNSCIESFFSHFKEECLKIDKPTSEAALIQAIDEYMYFYNNERFQKGLDKFAPVEYRTKLAS